MIIAGSSYFPESMYNKHKNRAKYQSHSQKENLGKVENLPLEAAVQVVANASESSATIALQDFMYDIC